MKILLPSPFPLPSLTPFSPTHHPSFHQTSRSLPVDPEERNFVRPVPNACYSKVTPEPLRNPMLIAASTQVPSKLAIEIER